MSSAAAERENRALEITTDMILLRLTELQTSIRGLITKVETDGHLTWHSVMDSYSLITGQLNTLLKNVKSERTPFLKRYISIPILLSPDRDEYLTKLTDNRVPVFSHDLVPHYLRTKPDPEVEAKYSGYTQRGGTPSPDVIAKMVANLDKVVRETLRIIAKEREEFEHRAVLARNEQDKTTLMEDTNNLLSAVWYGKNLRPEPTVSPMTLPSRHQVQSQHQQYQMKAVSSIKTNIKAGIQVHPYQRN